VSSTVSSSPIRDRVQAVVLQDPAAADKIIHDELDRVVPLEKSWYIPCIQPYQYVFWWPWLKTFTAAPTTSFFSISGLTGR